MHSRSSSGRISRRDFLTSSALGVVAVAGLTPAIHLPGRKRYDVVIRGGTVFDGSGGRGVESDVAIVDGRVARIAPRITDDARLVIDARGLAVVPGFIDIHSHGDGTLFADPRVESVIRQGVTTMVVGQDGSSRAPARTQGDDSANTSRHAYATFDEFFRAVDVLPSSVNVASMIGFGSVREAVVGRANRPATADELRQMVAIVDAAVTAGVCGGSTGLEYIPGAFAPTEELIALAKPLAARGLPYATHMRNEDDRLLEAIDESIAVARGAGCPLEISHLKMMGARNWNKIDSVLARIADARRGGTDVTFDCYPYVAAATGLDNLFPPWSREGSSADFVARLADPALADRIREATMAKVNLIGGWDRIMVTSVTRDEYRSAEGKRVSEYASAVSLDPYAATVQLLTRNRASVGMVEFVMSEENVKRLLADPLCTICSDGGALAVDGPAHTGHPHPRGAGTFPRVLGKYVREEKALSFADAIHKMTGATAARLKLRDRGRLADGLPADVVVLDPATVADRATFENPFQYPVGIRAVLVNGEPALMDGNRSSRYTGKAVRPA
jgi:N-acyl-D-amino-acid deacylase